MLTLNTGILNLSGAPPPHLFKEKFPCFPLRTWSVKLVTGYWAVSDCTILSEVSARLKGLANPNRRSYKSGPITANEVNGLMRYRSEGSLCCLGADAGSFEGPLRSVYHTSIRVWISHRAIVAINGRVTTGGRDKP